jgi:hypothetical protein
MNFDGTAYKFVVSTAPFFYGLPDPSRTLAQSLSLEELKSSSKCSKSLKVMNSHKLLAESAVLPTPNSNQLDKDDSNLVVEVEMPTTSEDMMTQGICFIALTSM